MGQDKIAEAVRELLQEVRGLANRLTTLEQTNRKLVDNIKGMQTVLADWDHDTKAREDVLSQSIERNRERLGKHGRSIADIKKRIGATSGPG